MDAFNVEEWRTIKRTYAEATAVAYLFAWMGLLPHVQALAQLRALDTTADTRAGVKCPDG